MVIVDKFGASDNPITKKFGSMDLNWLMNSVGHKNVLPTISDLNLSIPIVL